MRKYIILYRIIRPFAVTLIQNGTPRKDEGIIHHVFLSNNFLKYHISNIKISYNTELKESLIAIKAKSNSVEENEGHF